ncbi:unnamed protein product [Cyprideis torosa]|uniref:Uncharacterized protein n=1 Tax=Cyprideis torosa TaxID=163714 RepID=A0A7R8WBJ1_9CRUS|nr:unnamed protein product [Cyprideis torosa]CAG0892188.1 unnamed protein product [Cyprideis torosa]
MGYPTCPPPGSNPPPEVPPAPNSQPKAGLLLDEDESKLDMEILELQRHPDRILKSLDKDEAAQEVDEDRGKCRPSEAPLTIVDYDPSLNGGCLGTRISRSQSSTDFKHYPFSAVVMATYSNGGNVCSGSILRRDLVLTSAYCLANFDEEGETALQSGTVYYGDYWVPGTTSEALTSSFTEMILFPEVESKWAVHRSNISAFKSAINRYPIDVALIKTDLTLDGKRAAHICVLERGFHGLDTHEKLTFIGARRFGPVHENVLKGAAVGRLRFREAENERCESTECRKSQYLKHDAAYCVEQFDDGVCMETEEGGPVIIYHDQAPVLVSSIRLNFNPSHPSYEGEIGSCYGPNVETYFGTLAHRDFHDWMTSLVTEDPLEMEMCHRPMPKREQECIFEYKKEEETVCGSLLNLEGRCSCDGSAGGPGHQFPFTVHLALVSSREEYTCTGSFLNSKYILTSAHCLYDATDLTPRGGEFYYDQTAAGELRGIVEQTYVLPSTADTWRKLPPEEREMMTASDSLDYGILETNNAVDFGCGLTSHICILESPPMRWLHASEKYYAVGYATGSKNSMGASPVQSFPIRRALDKDCSRRATYNDPNWWCAGVKNPALCDVDAGGPIIKEVIGVEGSRKKFWVQTSILSSVAKVGSACVDPGSRIYSGALDTKEVRQWILAVAGDMMTREKACWNPSSEIPEHLPMSSPMEDVMAPEPYSLRNLLWLILWTYITVGVLLIGCIISLMAVNGGPVPLLRITWAELHTHMGILHLEPWFEQKSTSPPAYTEVKQEVHHPAPVVHETVHQRVQKNFHYADVDRVVGHTSELIKPNFGRGSAVYNIGAPLAPPITVAHDHQVAIEKPVYTTVVENQHVVEQVPVAPVHVAPVPVAPAVAPAYTAVDPAGDVVIQDASRAYSAGGVGPHYRYATVY